MKLILSKELYPKIAVLKAAYHFTDRCYFLINQDQENYIIDVTAKKNEDVILEQEFKNELLSQILRAEIIRDTKELRTLITMRAMASTIISEPIVLEKPNGNISENDILKDWFDK